MGSLSMLQEWKHEFETLVDSWDLKHDLQIDKWTYDGFCWVKISDIHDGWLMISWGLVVYLHMLGICSSSNRGILQLIPTSWLT